MSALGSSASTSVKPFSLRRPIAARAISRPAPTSSKPAHTRVCLPFVYGQRNLLCAAGTILCELAAAATDRRMHATQRRGGSGPC